jgi:uncharacterized membrane protein
MSPHLFLIHFPVAFVIVAAVLDAFGISTGNRSVRDWSWRFLLLGAIAVFAAFATGEGAKLNAGSSGAISFPNLELHQQWGSVGLWAIIGAALLRTLWRHRLNGPFSIVNLAIVVLAAALVIGMTLTGTAVRHFG